MSVKFFATRFHPYGMKVRQIVFLLPALLVCCLRNWKKEHIICVFILTYLELCREERSRGEPVGKGRAGPDQSRGVRGRLGGGGDRLGGYRVSQHRVCLQLWRGRRGAGGHDPENPPRDGHFLSRHRFSFPRDV